MIRRSVGVLAIAGPIAVGMLSVPRILAQSPTFEVVSVKPNRTATSIGNHFDPGRMSWTGVPLHVLITSAYGLQSYQISGGPNWMETDRWDIDAKTESPANRTQQLQMLQPLLEDRFQLKTHKEQREVTGYSLVLAKNGSKLHEVKEGEVSSRPAGLIVKRGVIDGHAMSIAMLAGFLRSELGRPLTENTGLAGDYDFKLEWVPDESQPNSGGNIPAPDSIGPSIFTAIQEQLGLKLEAQKVLLDILVIDHVDKPAAN